ncbi:MAG: Flp pilus assembly complex ATPase component TadA [Candidatus Omnitrophica bacterium]|nr:Flp pilus assembly complex ATPase component TadA [Candidatus Omnitrophota bacterium]
MHSVRERILTALLQMPGVTQEAIDGAMAFYRLEGVSIGEALVRKELIKEKDLLLLLVKELRIPSIDLRHFKLDEKLKEIVSERIARKYQLVPLASLGDGITVALSDPFNVFALDDLRDFTGRRIDVVMAAASQVRDAIDKLYSAGSQNTVAEVSKNIDVGDFEIVSEMRDDEQSADTGEQAPIIRMVNLVIKEALRQRASDIHMEPTEADMRVRYRIDGVLQDILDIPKENQGAVAVRIKIMARMDITSSQTPQDGRFKMRIGDKEVDFRVSILPTCWGSKIVMRVLDKGNLSIGLQHLGFSPKAVALINEYMLKPYGMILVTGPTGSGKSTTLYSMISQLNTDDKNIITVEDPVEYLVEGLTQIEVKADIGLTFAAGLRSILRQSPDIVMVGEIRDNETADIAIKASLTGQLVFSTLHTNDAAGALTRLVDMGVEPFLVASSLLMVCAQRLARKICPHCKEEVEIPAEVLKRLVGHIDTRMKFYEGRGCDRCRKTGYLGRFGLTEVLMIDDTVREMLLQGKSPDDIKEYARTAHGMRTLWDDGLERLAQGQTTVTELLRVASAGDE